MEQLVEPFLAKFTPGAAGIWTVVALLLIGWWKGLPSVLDAFANRQSKIEERMGKLLEEATLRFQREIAAADERHAHCMEGQDTLQKEVERLRTCVAEQQDTIEAMKRQMLQMQVSALRVEGNAPSPIIAAAMQQLDTVKGAGN